MNWLTVSFAAIALATCWYFSRLDKAQREHDAMIDREEARIREDARRMRAWYNSTRINVEGETESEIAERLIEMTAQG